MAFRSPAVVHNFLRQCQRVVSDCIRLATTDGIQQETVKMCIRRLENIERNIMRTTGRMLPLCTARDELLQGVKDLLNEFRTNFAYSEETSYVSIRSEPTVGSPSYNISEDQLTFLASHRFTNVQIGRMLNVSSKTIQRRRRRFGLRSSSTYNAISNDALKMKISQLIGFNDRLGANAVWARLSIQGVKVQRRRVRDIMLLLNPEAVARRSMNRLQRRTYSVAGPNSVWHIDGNHKLIRWRFVIHGAVDGYSRVAVFLHASDNNRQDTVLKHFVGAAAQFGVPSRVRTDHGGENNYVCTTMELLRGRSRSSAIRGTSVHNQRIERFWRDMWHGATNVFYNLFSFMEDQLFLLPDNHLHLWSLHYVFLPRLNRALADFVQQWNNHSLRTEGGKSPLQLFIARSLELRHSQLTAVNDLFDGLSSAIQRYVTPPNIQLINNAAAGFNWLDGNSVTVPNIPCPISQQNLDLLTQTVNPLDYTVDELGVLSFLRTLQFVVHHI